MSLPNLFTVDTKTTAAKYCVLIFSDSTVQAGLIRVHFANVETVSLSAILPLDDEKKRLQIIDEALQQLGKESEDVSQVIYILDATWLDENGEVLNKYQPIIQQIGKELLLMPAGYVVQQESLCDYFILKEPQLSSILLLFSDSGISGNWIDHGHVYHSVAVGRSDSLYSDMKELLSRLKTLDQEKPLPQNLRCASLCLASTILADIQQQLLDFQWIDYASMSQIPSIDLISAPACANILINIAGQAVQVELLNDGQESQNESNKIVENEPNEKKQSQATSFGVPISPEKIVQNHAPLNTGESFAVEELKENLPDEQIILDDKKNKGKKAKKINKKMLILIILLIFLLGLISFALWIVFFATATIVITPKTQLIAQELQLTLSTVASSSSSSATALQAEEIFVESEVTQETNTTGVKLVGEKAKGEVLILNKTQANKSFPKGTILTHENLKYLLDEDVEVPSSSVSAKPNGTGEEKIYGQKKVKITAEEIGIESNIDKDATFTVEKYAEDSYSAKAETAIEGGSSREVRVVSQTDLDILLADAKREFLQDAKKDLEAKAGQGEAVVSQDEVLTSGAKYSGKIGDELEKVSLTVKLKLTGLLYNKNDVKPIAQEVLQKLVPEGYSIEQAQPQVLSAPTASSSGDIVVDANISVEAVAIINEQELANQLAGAPLSVARQQLQTNSAIASANIIFSPNFREILWPYLPSQSAISVNQSSKP